MIQNIFLLKFRAFMTYKKNSYFSLILASLTTCISASNVTPHTKRTENSTSSTPIIAPAAAVSPLGSNGSLTRQTNNHENEDDDIYTNHNLLGGNSPIQEPYPAPAYPKPTAQKSEREIMFEEWEHLRSTNRRSLSTRDTNQLNSAQAALIIARIQDPFEATIQPRPLSKAERREIFTQSLGFSGQKTRRLRRARAQVMEEFMMEHRSLTVEEQIAFNSLDIKEVIERSAIFHRTQAATFQEVQDAIFHRTQEY